MLKKHKILIGIAGIIFIITSITVGIIFYKTASESKVIFKGICINGIDVGGMSKEEAKGILNERFSKKISNGKISLRYRDKIYDIRYLDIGLHYNIEAAVNEAFDYGKCGNIINKTISMWKLRDNSCNINLNLVYDKEILKGLIKSTALKINKQPVDAKIFFDGGRFSVKEDKYGEKVNEDKLIEIVSSRLESPFEGSEIEIPVERIDARITFGMLSKINTKISSFSTTFDPKDENRTGNLRIACKALNGTIVLSGEVFSMNKALGPIDESKGYKDAPIIVNNAVVPGLAGGICQVSSTAYNAALLSNLEIIERRPHGTLVSYVNPGRDAAIYGNTIDLKFRNTNAIPIYIEAIVEESELKINFYGADEHPGQWVEIATEIYEKIPSKIEYINDPMLEKGKRITEVKSIRGLKSKTYKSVYLNGKLVSKKLLSSDFYKPVDGKIRVGTKIILPNEEVSENETSVSNLHQNGDDGINTSLDLTN